MSHVESMTEVDRISALVREISAFADLAARNATALADVPAPEIDALQKRLGAVLDGAISLAAAAAVGRLMAGMLESFVAQADRVPREP